MDLFTELRRRNVLRVAAAYAVLSWLLLQVGDVLFEALGVPDWGIKLLIGMLLIGFVPTIVFSWVYELTPDGIKRESEVVRSVSITPETGRKLDRVTIGMLFIVAALVIGDRLWPEREPAPVDDPATTAQAEPEAPAPEGPRSIAVLPFTSMSDNPEDEFFADGISEELLNILAKIPQLKVVGRTSSFRYKDTNEDLRTIGKELGVEYLLEGSVRRSGEQVRITGQLVQVSDGFHLWSETFDRKLEDVFVLQDQIVRTIVQALRIQLADSGTTARSANPVAHSHVLQGRFYWAERHVEDYRARAIQEFELATVADPDYADAWAGLGRAIALSSPAITTGLPRPEHIERARAALERALELDPDNVEAHAAFSFILTQKMQWDEARHHAEEAERLAPGYTQTLYMKANLAFRTGDYREGARNHRQAISLDPHNLTLKRVLMERLNEQGRFDEARTLEDEYRRLSGESFWSFRTLFAEALDSRDLALMREYLERLRELRKSQPADALSVEYIQVVEAIALALEGDSSGIESAMQSISGLAEWGLLHYLLGNYDAAIGTIERSYDNNDLFAQSDWIFSTILKPGDPLLSHPRYIALWQKPGMAELAELRRTNGSLAGLPEIPDEG